MTKLSKIREEHERVASGQWIRIKDTDICVRVRGFLTPGYQRAQRAVVESFPKLKDDATPEQRIAHETNLGQALRPYTIRELVQGWWGVDAESDPVDLDVNGSTELLGECDGLRLERAELEGKIYRPLGDGTYQEMVPYSTELGLATFSELSCAEFFDLVRAAAHQVDRLELEAEVEALKKRRSMSSGGSPTETTPKT